MLAIRRQIEQGVAILKRGGIVAFPTDTVYGLGANAYLHQAVAQIYVLKKRPHSMTLPLLLASVSQIGKVAESVPEVAWRLANQFLPGALTLVLPKAMSVPDIITGGGMTVAVRVPAHPVPVALIRGLGSPLVGTSANVTGQPSLLTAAAVRAQFGDDITLIIDGSCPGGKESTIVDVTGEAPVILREGAISSSQIRQVCPNIKLKGGIK
ncbi:MAG: threonylcarbamoyl-AMP synthase [Dehalococcoidales bacterium]|nr:threonylcarbamoyl-AMP synthase [Dehalococcoidales bacterium]